MWNNIQIDRYLDIWIWIYFISTISVFLITYKLHFPPNGLVWFALCFAYLPQCRNHELSISYQNIIFAWRVLIYSPTLRLFFYMIYNLSLVEINVPRLPEGLKKTTSSFHANPEVFRFPRVFWDNVTIQQCSEMAGKWIKLFILPLCCRRFTLILSINVRWSFRVASGAVNKPVPALI